MYKLYPYNFVQPGWRVTKILAIMKLIILLLITAILQVSASTYAQKVTLFENNVSIQKVFEKISAQTGYDFLFSDKILKNVKPISIRVKGSDLKTVLDKIFKDQPLEYVIGDKAVVVTEKERSFLDKVLDVFTPSFTVHGVITDSKSGLPLPGVSVRIKGAPGGTSTDLNGKFSLTISSEDQILVFSFLGYAPREQRAGNASSALEIKLEEKLTELSQVVVVGYGTQRKALVTGSVAQVSSAELRTSPTATLSSMLQGRLPGLVSRQTSGQPGADGASLLIRGYNSLSSSSPLIIVDGFERDFPAVNPDEIESISILKDAAAAAVYGVKGANGVILVTTKRGSNQKPSITYNSSLSLSSNTNFPEFLDGPGYAYWYNKAQEMDGVAESARRFTSGEIERITNGDPEGVYGNTDWFGLLFKDYAPVYTNNLSVNGGNEKYKFFVSLGSYDQKGIIDRTSYNRYNARANLDAKVTDNFSASFNMALKDDNQKQPGLSAGIGNDYASIFSQAMMSYPFLPAYTTDGAPVGSFNAGNGNQNPIAARDLSGRQTTRSTRFQGNVSLRYDAPFVRGLSFKLNGAFDKGHSMKKAYLLPYLLSVYNNTTRTFTTTYARHALTGDATLNQWFSESWQKTFQPSVSYENKFGKHSLNALLLYEYREDNSESLSAGRRGYPLTDIMDITFGEEVIDDLVKGGHSMTRRAGYVNRLSYNYAGKYLFEFTGRLDGSDKFAPTRRWVFNPGFSAGWRISEESFFKNNVSFVNDLKLRASYGKLANDNTGNLNYVPTATLRANPVVLIGDKLSRPLSLSGLPNERLTWERTAVYNLGLDATMWNGLLGVEGDAFYRVTDNILQAQQGMPESLGGYYPQYVNSGMVDSRGFELVLTHRNRIGEFNYQVKGNVSWARSKIIETTEDVNVPDYLRKTGQKVGVKYGFVADGLFQSQEEIDNSALFGPTRVGEIKLKDLNGDGRITWDQDWTVIGGSDLPEMMFGLNLGGSYRGFDFNVFLQGAAMSDVALSGLYPGKDVYDNTFYTMPFYQDGNSPKYLVENAWTPENTNAKYPRLSATSIQSGGKFSSWWIKDGSYLRLKSVQIGYTLPSALTKRINISSVRLHVAGSNLFTISGLDYLDPEMPSVNQGYYPQQKLYEFGLSVTF